LERCRRFNHQLALLMIDVDHFKRVNDTHGHAVGDEVLKAFTRILEGNLRSVDLLGRLGGEEFAVVLPESDQNAAKHTAERLRAAVEALEFPFEDGTTMKITTSVGIAILAGAGETLDSLLARADTALYTAKGEGRNRVVVS
jgi:two-component system cell cycle response regulator